MTERLRSVLDELHTRLDTLYGHRLAQMILYGSQARGESDPGSDVDVLVVLGGAVTPTEEIARTSEIVAEVSLRHEVVISCVFVGSEDFSRRNGPFLRNVRREGVTL